MSGRNTFETIGLHSQTIPDTRAQSCGSLESFGHVQNYRGPFEGEPCRRGVEVWSRCIRAAFEAFEEHSRRTLNILTAFEPIRVVMELVKHARLHPEVVEEGLRVFYSQLLHQPGVMAITSPPLLC